MTEGCRTELLARHEISPSIIAAWADLTRRALEPSVFNEPGFAVPAAASIEPVPRFILVWQGRVGELDRLIGLCIVRSRSMGVPGAATTAWIHPQATSAFPLLDRDHADVALSALVAALPVPPRALLLHGVPLEGPTARLIEERFGQSHAIVERRARAVLLKGSHAQLSAKRRKEMQRQSNRLADQGVVTVRSARGVEAIEAAVEHFLDLEARGWKGRRGTAFEKTAALTSFLRAMTSALAQDGRCRIDTLALGDKPVGMGIVLRSGDRAYYWKTAFDEAFARLSPGVHLTLALTANQQNEPDISITDSCALPGHAMIDRLWKDRIVVADILVATTAGRSLKLALHIERARRRLRSLLKRGWHAVRPSAPNVRPGVD